MTHEQLIAAASKHAQENAGNFKIAGDAKFREAAVVCFPVECEGSPAYVEVLIDAKSGKYLRFTFIPRDSILLDDDGFPV